MGLATLLLIGGIFFLFLGAELLIRSAVQVALHFKVPPIVIGLTIVAFCTSLPEVFVSIGGQLWGEGGDIALGNVLGSNIANTGLVLPVYLLLRPCRVINEVKWRKMPILLAVYLLLLLAMLGDAIYWFEGVFLLIALVIYIGLEYVFPQKTIEIKEEISIHEEEKRPPVRITLQIFSILASIVLLALGTESLIEGSLQFAQIFHLSERIVAISLVALGTSLPELATAIVAAVRKQQGIILGTILGSNIFNSLLIIACATFIKPLIFTKKMLVVDYPLMFGFALLLWVLMFFGKDRLSRLEGAFLLLAYVLYIFFLFA